MADNHLYPGRWVAVIGTHYQGPLIREEKMGQVPGWRVQLTDDWSTFIATGNLTPCEPFDYNRFTR